MITALPVQQQMNLVILDTGYHLTQHDPDDTLTRDGSGRWMVPSGLQISPHLQQTLALLCKRLLSKQRLQLLLECAFPPPLEFASDQTIIRVDRVILSTRPGCLVSRLFER